MNVGRGEAILIQTPFQNQILINGGSDSTILRKLEKEMPFWDRKIEAIVLTDVKRDHLMGLIEVLKKI